MVSVKIAEFRWELISVLYRKITCRSKCLISLDRSLMVWIELERLYAATMMFVGNYWVVVIVPQSDNSLCNTVYLPKFGTRVKMEMINSLRTTYDFFWYLHYVRFGESWLLSCVLRVDGLYEIDMDSAKLDLLQVGTRLWVFCTTCEFVVWNSETIKKKSNTEEVSSSTVGESFLCIIDAELHAPFNKTVN